SACTGMTLDSNGWPEAMGVPAFCPPPPANFDMQRVTLNNGEVSVFAHRGAIFHLRDWVPEQDVVRSIRLSPNHDFLQLTVDYSSTNDALTNQLAVSYCPGDFDDHRDAALLSLRPLCRAAEPKVNASNGKTEN